MSPPPVGPGRVWRSKELNVARLVSFQVSLLVVVEIGVFPLICGWWLDICSLVRRPPPLSSLVDTKQHLSRPAWIFFFFHTLASPSSNICVSSLFHVDLRCCRENECLFASSSELSLFTFVACRERICFNDPAEPDWIDMQQLKGQAMSLFVQGAEKIKH